jgi:hypothetical protein
MELDAFWVRAGRIFHHDMRILAEWVERVDDTGVHIAASRLATTGHLHKDSALH